MISSLSLHGPRDINERGPCKSGTSEAGGRDDAGDGASDRRRRRDDHRDSCEAESCAFLHGGDTESTTSMH
ncbi:hypothetical protein BaRGS_00006058 [Batillaria attramentaria]|uniref:Uncharacterized protein n=1 Tax=Batillaria attramentaria TaxID=370345 RepID=A0ABD0LTV0_9CAEN